MDAPSDYSWIIPILSGKNIPMLTIAIIFIGALCVFAAWKNGASATLQGISIALDAALFVAGCFAIYALVCSKASIHPLKLVVLIIILLVIPAVAFFWALSIHRRQNRAGNNLAPDHPPVRPNPPAGDALLGFGFNRGKESHSVFPQAEEEKGNEQNEIHDINNLNLPNPGEFSVRRSEEIAAIKNELMGAVQPSRKLRIDELKNEFVELERRYSAIKVRVQFTNGQTEDHPGKEGLQYIVNDIQNGMTALMLLEHRSELIDFKRVFRKLSEIKRELLNRKPLSSEEKKLFEDVNDFYRSSFEAYALRIAHSYRGSDYPEFKEWNLFDVSFRDVWITSRTRPKITGRTNAPPEIVLLRMNIGDVGEFGKIRIKIRNPQKNAFLLEEIAVKNDSGRDFDYSTDYESRMLIAPQWIEPDDSLDFILFVKELQHDKYPNALIHIEGTFDEIQLIKSNEETVPTNPN